MSAKIEMFKWIAILLLVAKATNGQSLPENGPLLKKEAFVVLQGSCNPCHQKLNPSKVFDLENMEEFAELILEEVFVKQRMPLGFWNKLEADERKKLALWLEAYLNTEVES